MAVLEAAEAWGTVPWNIAGGSQIVWWTRWRVRRDLVAAMQNSKEAK